MATVYDAAMGVRVAKEPTKWVYQNWWNGDYSWNPLAIAPESVLDDILKDSKHIPSDLREDLFKTIEQIKKDASVKPASPAPTATEQTNNNISTEEVINVLNNNPSEVAEIIRQVKTEIDARQDQVKVQTVDEFLEGFAKLWAIAEPLKIKMVDQLGEIKIAESVPSALRIHGTKVVEMHLTTAISTKW